MKNKIIIGIGVILFIGLFLDFWHKNIYIPKLYEKERMICLSDADSQTTQELIDTKRNICFRTYPHFN